MVLGTSTSVCVAQRTAELLWVYEIWNAKMKIDKSESNCLYTLVASLDKF